MYEVRNYMNEQWKLRQEAGISDAEMKEYEKATKTLALGFWEEQTR